ncbi:MAG: hypothetical protein K0S32_1970 [Bacteroidetes bacterium]|jgi:hypothetical protein|nr:hypothetical protein [Bacteroidota bacterium]
MKTAFKLFLFFSIICSIDVSAQASYKTSDKVMIEENGRWYPGYIMEVSGEKYKIHYDGYDSKYDTWVTTARLKAPAGGTAPATASANQTGVYNVGDVVLFLNGGEWTEGDVASPISSAGRYQVHYGTSGYTYVYPKDMKATDKPNVNIAKAKEAEEKKKADEAKAKKDAEDAVGVIEGEKYKQFMADCSFATEAVGQLCYYLAEHPSTSEGLNKEKLGQNLKTLEQLDKIIKEKYPNAKSAKYVNRFSDHYSKQPGVFREVAEQRNTLAKKALAASIEDQLRDSRYSFSKEFNDMKKSSQNEIRATLLCVGFMEWAYFPAAYSKYKNDIRSQYEKAYKAAGLEFVDDEVFVTLNQQLGDVKKYTVENISSYSLDRKKKAATYVDKEAEAVAIKGFKKDFPNATVVFVGFTGNYVISTDDNYVPPKPLGKGKGGCLVASVPGVPYLVSYYFPIEKNYVGGGNYGPTQLGGGGTEQPFTFEGMVSEK